MLSSIGLKKLPNSPVFRLVCTPKAAKVAFASGQSGLLCENRIVLLHGRDVSRGPWKKNGALHSVIRVSYQAATSACSRTSLRRW